MIDYTSRDTLPKDDFGKVLLPVDDILKSAHPADMGTLLNSGLAFAGNEENDYNALLTLLRNDYYECCRSQLETQTSNHQHYGDDCGDYMNATADFMCWLQANFDFALWHSELDADMIAKLNLFLNCADEDHCIHRYSIDGPNLKLEELCIDWEQCPNSNFINPIGP